MTNSETIALVTELTHVLQALKSQLSKTEVKPVNRKGAYITALEDVHESLNTLEVKLLNETTGLKEELQYITMHLHNLTAVACIHWGVDPESEAFKKVRNGLWF